MSRELMLDDETNAKFVPVYSQYRRRPDELPPQAPWRWQTRRTTAPGRTEDRCRNREDDSGQIRAEPENSGHPKSYYSKFRKILTQKQILKIYNSERDNMGEIQKEMNKRRDGQQGFNGRQGFNGNRGFNGNHGLTVSREDRQHCYTKLMNPVNIMRACQTMTRPSFRL